MITSIYNFFLLFVLLYKIEEISVAAGFPKPNVYLGFVVGVDI